MHSMIESSVILFVFLVAGALFVGARLMAQNARKNPALELARLQESLVWHEERLRQARLKNWDHDMVERIAAQLAETQQQLARIDAETVARRPAG
jgi:hypothetical protein